MSISKDISGKNEEKDMRNLENSVRRLENDKNAGRRNIHFIVIGNDEDPATVKAQYHEEHAVRPGSIIYTLNFSGKGDGDGKRPT